MRVLFFLVFFSITAQAAGISGQLKSTTDDYPYHFGPPTQDLIPYVSLELSQKIKLSPSWHVQWKATGLTNTASSYSPENFHADIPEAFIEMKWGESKWRAGMNTVNWAVADVNSPSDTVNTLATFHPLRPTKQGAPMLEGLIGPETFNLDLIYIPVQRRPLLPSKDSRWLPRQVLVNVPTGNPSITEITVPPMLDYQYNPPEDLDNALNNNYGAKLASHLGSVDLQATYFEGAAPNPKIHATINTTFGNPGQLVAQSPIYLAPDTYRVRTTGMGFAWAMDRLIIRGESAYQDTISKSPIPDLLQPWSWTSVLAVETNVSLGSSTLTILGEYYYTKNPQAADNFLASSYRLFDNTGVLGGRFAYSDTLTINLSALYEPVTNGVFAQAGFDQKLSDHLSWGMSYHQFAAQKDGLIKTFEKDSFGSLEMVYYF